MVDGTKRRFHPHTGGRVRSPTSMAGPPAQPAAIADRRALQDQPGHRLATQPGDQRNDDCSRKNASHDNLNKRQVQTPKVTAHQTQHRSSPRPVPPPRPRQCRERSIPAQLIAAVAAHRPPEPGLRQTGHVAHPPHRAASRQHRTVRNAPPSGSSRSRTGAADTPASEIRCRRRGRTTACSPPEVADSRTALRNTTRRGQHATLPKQKHPPAGQRPLGGRTSRPQGGHRNARLASREERGGDTSH